MRNGWKPVAFRLTFPCLNRTSFYFFSLTSSKEERDLVNGYGLGANSYIQKPVDFEQFRETVKAVGLYWLVINQPPVADGCHTRRSRYRSHIKRGPSLGGCGQSLH